MRDNGVDEASSFLTAEELTLLEGAGPVIRYPAGSVLFGEGEETDFALLMRKGHVKIQVGANGRVVAIRGAGEIVGEMAAVRRRSRSASVLALDEVEALYLPGGTWLDFLYDNPRAMHAQLITAEERLEEATRKTGDSNLGVEQRLAKVLVELTSSGLGTPAPEGIVLRLSQRDLADVVGASRESIVQVIRALKRAGVVATGRQATILRDVDTLGAIARGDMTASS